MKVAILAGGLGTRLSEETRLRPKPMVEIGDQPILWHIMKIYSYYGYNDFAIALGYRGADIKDYFLNLGHRSRNMFINVKTGEIDLHGELIEDWNVDLLDTGFGTQTGGRVKRLQEAIGDHRFMLTYGDGLSDINISDLVRYHESHGALATVTAVRPPARFGGMEFEGDRVSKFTEKPQIGEGWISGGFFVFEPEVFDYLSNDETILEREPLEKLADDGQLFAFRHEGFWQCMDTLRDVRMLNEVWARGAATWKVWDR